MSMVLHQGDCLEILRTLPDRSIQTCVTSPPYWGLRNYGIDGQLGLEPTPEKYTQDLVAVFREVWRVLRDDGTLWLNLGDSYATSPGNGRGGETCDGGVPHRSGADKTRAGLKPKNLVGIPWRVAFALQADGWYLRSDIIWYKTNPMTESVRDRPTKSHEYIFLLTKRERYFYDSEAIKEPSVYPNDNRKARSKVDQKRMPTDQVAGVRPGDATYPTRNKRDVWMVSTAPYKGAHFATFPPKLIEPCILAGSKPGDTVLDPFNGAGTTGMVSLQHGRSYIGIDISSKYLDMTRERLADVQLPLLDSPAHDAGKEQGA